MADWKQILLNFSDNADDQFDRLKYRLQRRLSSAPVTVVPYLSYGSRSKVHFRGRVMMDKGITSAQDNDTVWKNLVNMYRRFQSDEIPLAKVRISFQGVEIEVTADEEGYINTVLDPAPPLAEDQVLFPVQYEVLSIPGDKGSVEDVVSTGQVIIPNSKAQFGIVSDMDDTVMQTDVLHLMKMARNTFLGNSHTRLPFEGVAAFYQALQAGTQQGYNPIFYVSSSPWNLYDLFMDFFEVRNIPLGAMFLKDLGVSDKQFVDSGHSAHKVSAIETLLNIYPELPFILVGDSGQQDATIYSSIVHQYADRIKAVYIRDVNRTEERKVFILDHARHTQEHGVELLLVPDTYAAAEHAAKHGFILESALPNIHHERKEDAKEPELMEKLTLAE